MYGIAFIVLGNLSGNAIALGRYVMLAAGHDDPGKGPVIGIAIAALVIITLLHVFSRRGGILVNNFFAVLKVCMLLMIIIVGIATRTGRNFNTKGPRPTGVDMHTKETFGGVQTSL